MGEATLIGGENPEQGFPTPKSKNSPPGRLATRSLRILVANIRRTFAAQIEVLSKRRNGGKQPVVVRHWPAA